MNLLQRWLRRLGQAFAVLRDPDAGLLRPLPPPLVDPRLDTGALTEQARRQGLSDGEQYLYDGWSFGDPADSTDAIHEPAYVEELRARCAGAVSEYHDRQQLTEARMADLQLVVRDADQDMRAARHRMAQVAVHDQIKQLDSLRAFLRQRDIDPDQWAMPPLDDPVWEGDAPPMRLRWRIPLVAFLLAVVFMMEHYAAQAYLPLDDLGAATGLVLTGAVAALTVLGPLVSGQLLRNRHATGFDRTLTALSFVLLLPTLAIVVGFGLLAAALIGHGLRTGDPTAATSSLRLTPATMIVVFDVALFLACAMAYAMGLAQRHPFQQSFGRNRQLRDQTANLMQRMGTRINDDYRSRFATVPDGTEQGPPPAAEREAAIRHAYAAAED
ncbi:MAG: hypothetical protein ABI418_15525, partial [Jatrophihabitantaceae bacterium]